MPLLSSATRSSTMGVDALVCLPHLRLRQRAGFCDAAQWPLSLLSRDGNDCSGVERLFFCADRLEDGVAPTGLPLLKPWLRAVFLELFQFYEPEERSESNMDSKESLSAPPDLREIDEEDGTDDEAGNEDTHDDAPGGDTWFSTWHLEE